MLSVSFVSIHKNLVNINDDAWVSGYNSYDPQNQLNRKK